MKVLPERLTENGCDRKQEQDRFFFLLRKQKQIAAPMKVVSLSAYFIWIISVFVGAFLSRILLPIGLKTYYLF
jgi:uncharacterized membrane protein (DUF485 family)